MSDNVEIKSNDKFQLKKKVYYDEKNKFHVEVYENYYDPAVSMYYYSLIKYYVPWPRKIANSRMSVKYGDEGLIYTVTYRGNTTHQKLILWSELPVLLEIKDKLETFLEKVFTTCIVQFYPNGKAQIKPHMDKEMKLGTWICGISLGQTRIIDFVRYQNNYEIPLPMGSLYVIKEQTNSNWLHSIREDDSDDGRISLTFRDY
jgi:alkylated DNA repair dioxygenase AlkB